ncbi:MAG TPA: TlpA disulfide reductase family protein [Atribacteraceae bacterium]|nr:TlpA disulfide reductase family protein [Atribacteraceae bacterium]
MMEKREEKKGGWGKNPPKKLIPVAVAVVVVVFFLFRSGMLSSPPQASDFTLETLEGEKVSLADYLGQPVVMAFFLARCPDCNKEAQLLNEMHERYGASQGLVILGIGLRQEIEEFVERNQIIYPVLYDRDMTVARLYDVSRVPHTVFIDRQGRVVRERVELMPKEDLEKYIQQIL